MAHPDDTARRETVRRSNGQFGNARPTEPEVALRDRTIEGQGQTDTVAMAREELILATIEFISWTMPAEADFVNFDLHPDRNGLVILEVLGDYGMPLDGAGYAHIDEALASLGEPYDDFDGDLVLNSLEVFGWERTELYDSTMAAAAHDRRALAHARLERATRRETDLAAEADPRQEPSAHELSRRTSPGGTLPPLPTASSQCPRERTPEPSRQGPHPTQVVGTPRQRARPA